MSRHVIIGIAGHVAHGKTTLVNLLAGERPPMVRGEAQRSRSVEAKIVPLKPLPETRTVLVDVPGHSHFLKNTLRGLSGVEAAILVVAADDGVMRQTTEHLQLLKLLKVKNGFTVLSKADLVDNEILEPAELEIQDAIRGSFLEGCPVVPYSAVDGTGLQEIHSNLQRLCGVIPGKDSGPPFRLWIDGRWHAKGFGTVVSGTVLSSTVQRDETVLLMPDFRETKARFLEVFRERVDRAIAGQRVGINLRHVNYRDVRRGMALIKPGELSPGSLLNAHLEILQTAQRPVVNYQRVKLCLGTSIHNTLVVLMEKDRLEPGEKGLVQLRLMHPVAALPGDPFVMFPLNANHLTGGGTILEVSRQKFRPARVNHIIPYLRALQEGSPRGIIEQLLRRATFTPLSERDIAAYSGLPCERVQQEIRKGMARGEFVQIETGGVYSKECHQALKSHLLGVIGEVLANNPLKAGVATQELRKRSGVDESILECFLVELCREGRLDVAVGGYTLVQSTVLMPQEQAALLDLLLRYAEESGFVHFNADMFCKTCGEKYKKNEVQRLLDYLLGLKKLIRLKNNRYMTPRAMDATREKVKRTIENKGRLTLEDSKQILGYGRTGGVPVLEYLDSVGLTLRVGNERILSPNAESSHSPRGFAGINPKGRDQ